ncbi:MAG: hypothetical protein ACR2PL_22295 [Dehalococcoidia bacterium]
MDVESRRVLFCIDGHVVTIDERRVSVAWDGGRADVSIDEGKPESFDFPGLAGASLCHDCCAGLVVLVCP